LPNSRLPLSETPRNEEASSMKFIPFLISAEGHSGRQLVKWLKNVGFLLSGLLLAKGQSSWEPIVSGFFTLAISWFEFYISFEANKMRINTRDELEDLKAEPQVSPTPADKPTEVLPVIEVPIPAERFEIPGQLRYPKPELVQTTTTNSDSHTVSYDVDGMPMIKVFSNRFDAVLFRNSKPGARIV